MTKIWDCFTYFNEEEILRIRLEELDSVVDHFVIVEAGHTFTGEPKRTYFDDIGDWIDPYRDKIKRVLYTCSHPPKSRAWDLETKQRNAILTGIKDAEPDDIIIMGDADEIPRANMLNHSGPVQLDTTQYFWGPHWQLPQHCNRGARPVISLKKFITSPQEMRAAQLPRIPNAAWHFSFFDVSNIDKKITAFSHTEFNKPEYKDIKQIKRRIAEGIDPFDRFPLKWTEIDETFPKRIQNTYGT